MEKQESFMPEGTPHQEIIDALQTHAIKVYKSGYDAELDVHEIDDRKNSFIENTKEMDNLNEEKKEKVKDITDQIKALKSTNQDLWLEIKTGKVQKEGTLYDVPNFENGQMVTYDHNGDFVKSRKMTPQEKKGGGNIFLASKADKTGTND